MVKSCERALQAGLPGIAFTEHVDHTTFVIASDGLDADHPLMRLADSAGYVTPTPLDVTGYHQAIEACRERFPDLRIMSGVELGEPHWHADAVRQVLAAGTFDRVLGSLHCLPDAGRFREPAALYIDRRPAEVLREYLAEVERAVRTSDAFTVLAHIDYGLRSWPLDHPPFDPADFEDEFRAALRATAERGIALEVNTRLPPRAEILLWWREEGGQAITFGSDAHEPAEIARGFAAATQIADAFGFRPGADPLDFWHAAL